LIGILPQNILQIIEISETIRLIGLGVLAFSMILLAITLILKKKGG